MQKVRRLFFLDNEETERLRAETGDSYILNNMPHYVLEDGSFLYSCGGVTDWATEVTVRKPVKNAGRGDGTE